MTTTQMKLVEIATAQNVGSEYTQSTRNPDKAVRDKFAADRSVRGTRAWAICIASFVVRGPGASDEDCDEAIAALTR